MGSSKWLTNWKPLQKTEDFTLALLGNVNLYIFNFAAVIRGTTKTTACCF